LRAVFGTDDEQNAVHGSESTASAEREIRFFFPDGKLLIVVDNQQSLFVTCEVRLELFQLLGLWNTID